MAELEVFDYHGPGERKTAETLARELPVGWTILAGRALPTARQDDVDLIVIGENLVFAVEEKSWGPRVEALRGGWLVKGSLRQSPVNRITHLSRVVAGLLGDRVSGFRHAAGRDHLVQQLVIMSNDRLQLSDPERLPEMGSVIDLAHASETLIGWDRERRTGLPVVRNEVIEFLGGLSARKEIPESLGGYSIVQELPGVGRARQFEAKNDLDQPVILRCYPIDGWGPDFDVTHFVRREREATEAIAHANRGWRSEPVFSDDARRWTVVPIRVEASVSLRRSGAAGVPNVWEGASLTSEAASIVRDAFVALAEVHEHDIVHRGLCPDRVLLAKNQRVMFKDFYLAKAIGEETIAPAIEDAVDVSTPWRAPECRVLIGAASAASDVYSLARSIGWWLKPGEVEGVEDRIAELSSAEFVVLRACLSADPSLRPAPHDVAAAFTAAVEPETVTTTMTVAPSKATAEFATGALIGDRYRIDKKLGSGGFATSWLATDTRFDRKRVMKEFHDESAQAKAQEEFLAADDLRSEFCAGVYDLILDPSPALVIEFVEGDNLRDVAEAGTADAEAYRRIGLDVLAGLAHMHGNQRLHRDISPGNIIVTPEGRAKLIDFGLSTSVVDATSVVGTPPFMPPEVMSGGKWSQSSDLYGLGVTLLKSMLNRYPYEGDPRRGTDDRQKVRPLTAEEAQMWGETGAAILQLFFSLAQPNPSDRPQSALAVARELEIVIGNARTEGEPRVNPTVDSLRRLYRGSSLGNAGNRGLDDPFARETYLPTKLDSTLGPAVLEGELDVVILTGNPGDGKTSFLVELRKRLDAAGAQEMEQSPAGWRVSLGDRSFAAVYDASESRDGQEADDLVEAALEPFPGMDASKHTALLAVNDGRLLQFFLARADEYPAVFSAVEAYTVGRPNPESRVALVDLKRRSLAPLSESDAGLAGRILDSMTDDPFWEACAGCSARATCPMLANRELLQRDGKPAVLELVQTSHLRRKRRATFRDVRSAFGWLVTGDRSCEEVHEAVAGGLDLRNSRDTLAFDLAFSKASQDYLVKEWCDVDPENLPAPTLDRLARTGDLGDRSIGKWSKRQAYFLTNTDEGIRNELRAYRYLPDLVLALSSEEMAGALAPRILLGMSRLLGAPGYAGKGFAILEGGADGWSVLREVDAHEFSLARSVVDSPFVESQAEFLQLVHSTGRLNLTLDAAELVLRAADGELLNDAASEAVQLELVGFGDRLKRAAGKTLHVVDPAGRATTVAAIGPRIEVSR